MQRVRASALVCGALLSWGLLTPGPFSCTRVAAQSRLRTHLVMLGTGNPNANPERWGPSSAVVVDNRAYLVDAGVGVVRRAAKAARDGHIPALAPARLDLVFITHLHSDHTLGCPDLLLSPWVLGRDRPLQVWGPPGTARMFRLIE